MSLDKGTTLEAFTVQRNVLVEALRKLDVIKPSCASCEQFELGKCSKFGEIPIAFQKVEGDCPDWTYDGVPFS